MKTKHLLLLLVLSLSSMLSAKTITVTNGNDSGDGSLRKAVADASAGDIINFNFTGDIVNLTSAQISLEESITINGINAATNQKVILKAAANLSVFNISGSLVINLNNLVFDGTGIAGNTAIKAPNGSRLNIEDCVFKNINAQNNNGGAARIQGMATIKNSIFQGNTSDGGYGGGALCIYHAADVTIEKCSFINNSCTKTSNTGGGAIVARGTVVDGPCNVTIINSTFANNTSAQTGGAVLCSVQSSSDFTANLTAINCTFTGNQGDGAVTAFVTSKGSANVHLVNSLVVNNINAAGNTYSDLVETKSGTATGSVLIDPNYVIYSQASETINFDGKHCIKVDNPETENIFLGELQTFGVNNDKKRPIIYEDYEKFPFPLILLSESSIALGAGISTLEGYTIPTDDQVGDTRPTPPAIGALEYKEISGVSNPKNQSLKVYYTGQGIMVEGLTKKCPVEIYDVMGKLLYKSIIEEQTSIPLHGIHSNIVIIKIDNQRFKILVN
ncbi:MAG: hypothetical protein KBG25_02855 [Paludibacteraceae bacterium]|nr:hypothetical protein [Paludibacteraceae bacterium]